MKGKPVLKWLMVVAGVGLAIIVPLSIASYIAIDGFVPNATVQVIGRIIVDVGIALLAFWSVIFVFLLRSFQTYRDTKITESEATNLKLADLKVRKQYESKNKQKSLDSEIVQLEKWDKYLMQYVVYAEAGIRVICEVGIFVMAAFASAIIWTMAIVARSMSQYTVSDEYVQFPGLHSLDVLMPMVLLMAGIIGIMVGFLFIYPKKPKGTAA